MPYRFSFFSKQCRAYSCILALSLHFLGPQPLICADAPYNLPFLLFSHSFDVVTFWFCRLETVDKKVFCFLIAGTLIEGDTGDYMQPKQSEGNYVDRTSCLPSSSNREEILATPPYATNSWIKVHGKEYLLSRPSDSQEVVGSTNMVKHSIPLKLLPPAGHTNSQSIVSFLDPRMDTSKNARFGEGCQSVPSQSSEYTFEVDDLNIPWSDLVLKEKIGAGSFWLLLKYWLQ